MKSQEIYVLAIDCEYGMSVWAFTTEEKARDKLAAYVAEWWSDLDGEDAFSDFPNRDEAIARYFEEIGDESYVLTTTTVE
jgi:hypothetical protein